MEREDYEKVVKKHFAFKLKKDLKLKQVSNIIKYIATDIRENDIIGFNDTGFMKNGKSGFLITKDAFYDSSHKVRIPFKNLESITYTKESSVTVQATFHYADGSVLEDEIIIAYPDVLIDVLHEIARGYNAETIIVETQKKKTVAENEITKKEAPIVREEEESPVLETISKSDEENSKEPEPKKEEAAKVLEPTGKELVEQGYNYQEGKGVPYDSKKAYECYEKAVELNYSPAYYYLANMYKKGWYVDQSNERACELLVKGAGFGDMRAMDELIVGTARGIYLPSKGMLKKMDEYGKTVLAGDSYFKPFVERIEVLANIEGDVEAFLCFTEDDLNQGVICPKCGNVLYPVSGKKLVYCTKCYNMIKAEYVERKTPKLAADEGEVEAKEILATIKEECGNIALTKQSESPKVSMQPQHTVWETRSYEENIKDVKAKLEKIREERDYLYSENMGIVFSLGQGVTKEVFIKRLIENKYDLDRVVLTPASQKGTFYVSDLKQIESAVDGLFLSSRGDTNEKLVKEYTDVLNKHIATFATKNVEQVLHDHLSKDDRKPNLNVAILGKNEKEKAVLIRNIVQTMMLKNEITIPEIMHKKSTEYAVSIKMDTSEYQVNLVDCIDDTGCVRVMLNSQVEWNAVIIEWDMQDDAERYADLFREWAWWVEHAKIPCTIVYIKKDSLDDDDLCFLLEIMKEEIAAYMESYNGSLMFFDGLVPEEVDSGMPLEERETIMDMMDFIEATRRKKELKPAKKTTGGGAY